MPTVISNPHFSDQLPSDSKKQLPRYSPGDFVLIDSRRASLWFNLKEDQRLGLVLAKFSAEEVVTAFEKKSKKSNSSATLGRVPFIKAPPFQSSEDTEEIAVGPPFWYLVWAFGASPGLLKKKGGVRLWEGFLTKYDKA